MRGQMRAQLYSLPKAEASFIEPMECLSVSKLPEGDRWFWEVKLDGLLAACNIPENGNVPWRKLDLPNDSEKRRMDTEFRGRARFLVDESMGKEVAEILQHNGYKTKYVAELGLA